jgi:hypothetical protein
MDPTNYGLIEMALSFGVVLLFCAWQLVSLERAKKKTREKTEAAASPEGKSKKS